MGPDRAELSSIASSVADLARRVSSMLELAAKTGNDTLAADLAVAERSLLAAHRKLDHAAGH